ncbi:MAG TPA: NAD+ synthase [Candidatus Bathyarchaeia archaeon]|nr:NAD+ synthase [Candidatus Bathyarchaeia archaeon]
MSPRFGEDPFSIKDPKETVERIERFIRDHFQRIGAKLLVVGMSGGLDSSVTAAICSKAVGGRSVLGYSLPESETWKDESIRDAKLVAKKFSIRLRVIDITHIINTTEKLLSVQSTRKNAIARANLKARLRAMILYYYSNTNNGLVVGTSDKSEMILGYFTKYGDGACDIAPLADMYKTSIRFLARHLSIPKTIISKPPSPELWPGQTAEQELGVSYEKLDRILWGLERWMTPREIASELELPLKLVTSIRHRWVSSEHKRRPPLAMKLGYRTPGQDLRIPYSL